MFCYGKGAILLQRLKIISSLLLIFVLSSCVSNNIEQTTTTVNVDSFFKGGEEDEWLEGIHYLKESIDEKSFYTLLGYYLDDKFEIIHESMRLLLLNMANRYSLDFDVIISYAENSIDSKRICELINDFSHDDSLLFAKAVYKSELEARPQLIEDLGNYVLDYDDVITLYATNDKNVKTGVLSSTGVIDDLAIYDWLVERLYESDEELSSAAVFSLSKHGNTGFSYLAKNLVSLSNRLILISIDLLTFNKVKEAYVYYSHLLQEPNDLITERVLKSYKSLGLQGVDYIIDALILSHPGVKMELLELLESISGADYLNRVLFLLDTEEFQDYLIDLCFKKADVDIIESLLVRGDFSVEQKVVYYAIENRLDLLITEEELTYFTLNYFLENYERDVITSYFEDLGYESNYIEDYNHLLTIYNNLNAIDAFEQLNGEVEYVTRYFEIEHNIDLAVQEDKLFYQNMEDWLETGEYDLLENSLALKRSSDQDSAAFVSEKEFFLQTLSEADVEHISSYEKSLINIKINYRNLTFRLKSFGRYLITRRGFYYIIK